MWSQNPDEFSKDPNQMMLDVEGKNIRIFGFFGLVEKARKAGLSLSGLPLFPDRGRDAGSRHRARQHGARL